MPLMVQFTERGAGPVIVCDHCGERIVDGREGYYEWDGEASKVGHRTDIYFVHKSCVQAHERRRGVLLDAMELHVLVSYLADNLGLAWEQSQKHARAMSEHIG